MARQPKSGGTGDRGGGREPVESVKQLAGLLALALPGAAPLGSTASTEGALASGARLLALGHPHLPYMAMAVRRYRPPLKGMRHSLPGAAGRRKQKAGRRPRPRLAHDANGARTPATHRPLQLRSGGFGEEEERGPRRSARGTRFALHVVVGRWAHSPRENVNI
eukprot:scaffold31563_cov27-Tisochrysis_lutea.AAC.9